MSIWKQTQREKLGSIDGLNLFFGALLGANLGTLDALPPGEYAQLIIILAGLVAAIRMAATSERRIYAIASLLAVAGFFMYTLLRPGFIPDGMAEADAQRLATTIAVWIGAALLFEFYPTRDDTPA